MIQQFKKSIFQILGDSTEAITDSTTNKVTTNNIDKPFIHLNVQRFYSSEFLV